MIKMETQEDIIIKKKRSKRPKPLSCSAGGGGEEEEKDMANCLILLAQSCNQKSSSSSPEESSSVEQSQQNKASSATILEKDIYECKTCNRRFHSFQALGGHRASHKKPKPPGSSLTPPESSSLDRLREEQSTMLSLQISNRVFPCISTSNAKPRVHECSICGAEFNSGQALGGHMRRHRPIPVASCNNTKQETFATKKRRPVLCLDLNLPAPDEDEDQIDAKFPFPSKEQVIVFSASPLVDCHY